MVDEGAANSLMRMVCESVLGDKSLRFNGKALIKQKDAVRYILSAQSDGPHKDEIKRFKEVAAAHGWKSLGTIYYHCRDLGKENGTNKGTKKKAAAKAKKKLITQDAEWHDVGAPLMGLESVTK